MVFEHTRMGRLGLALLVPLVWMSKMPLTVSGQSNGTVVKGGYYQSGSSHVLPVNASLFTHLFYAFAKVDDNTSMVLTGSNDGELNSFSSKMKAMNPDVITLISINSPTNQFALVLQSSASRQAFINSSISVARTFHLDGIDLDWEFPKSEGNMTAFGSFLYEWRQAVEEEAKQTASRPLLLTAAVYYSSTLLFQSQQAYPIKAIADNLEFVNIMCYDFHGSWNTNFTGANANLYDPNSKLSADYGIRSWLDAGLPAEKAVLGLTMYGRSWVLQNQSLNAGLNAPAIAAGPAQNGSQTLGVFWYSEVVSWIAKTNATVVKDLQQVTSYCYANNVWLSFEDPLIISKKVLYAKMKGLRGYFFWAVNQDNEWQLASAASYTMDYALFPETPSPLPSGAEVPSPEPSKGAAGACGPSSYLTLAAALLVSVFLLVSSNSVSITG